MKLYNILVKYNNNGILQWYTFISGVSGQPSICVDNRFIKGIDTNNENNWWKVYDDAFAIDYGTHTRQLRNRTSTAFDYTIFDNILTHLKTYLRSIARQGSNAKPPFYFGKKK